MAKATKAANAKTSENILVITIGDAPGVVTETVWALLQREIPWRPDEIHLVTTTLGDKHWADADGVPRRQLSSLLAAFNVRPIVPKCLVPKDRSGKPIADIRTEEENVAFATDLTRLIAKLRERNGVLLHVSMAGGRKNMSSYAQAAISLCGLEIDELSHTLVNPPELEYNRSFFWPGQEQQTIGIVRKGEAMEIKASDAEIVIIPSPFVRLRRFSRQIPLFRQNFDYWTLVEKVQERVDRYVVELDIGAQRLRVGNSIVGFADANQEFALYRLLVTALMQSWPGYGPGGDGHNHRGWIGNNDFRKLSSQTIKMFFECYADCFKGAPDESYENFKTDIERNLRSGTDQGLDYVANRFKNLRLKLSERIKSSGLSYSAQNRVLPGKGYVNAKPEARERHQWRYGLQLEPYEIEIIPRNRGEEAK